MWNCQSLEKSLTVYNIKVINKTHSPEVLFLCETKNNSSTVECVLRRCGFNSMFTVEPIGMAGGYVIAWKAEIIMQIVEHDSFFIYFKMEDRQGKMKWEVIGVYLHTEEGIRAGQFNRVLEVLKRRGESIIVMGDYNAIRSNHEKEGGRITTATSIQKFNDFINFGV
ncbi:uncharacterized protein [Arachis hypogaea]|uniref:uncharacterized protein n=1 Tax=Arachis hypogaea TaxID=3818 RepID=UPI003B22596E